MPHLWYEFGPYKLDPAQCRLLKGHLEIKLRPRLFDLLVVFVSNPGRMLTKDELLQAVWPNLSVEEGNLTVSVNSLRRELSNCDCIETVARRGYRFVVEVKTHSLERESVLPPQRGLEDPGPPGGAMPLSSIFYVMRDTDEEFNQAIARRDSVVLVKGPRQVGKTSLLARALQKARQAGAKVVLSDFQHLSANAFESSEKLLLTLAELLADQLDLPVLPHQRWNSFLSPSSNFEGYLRREALTTISSSVIWGLDEVDRLFNCDFASEIFGLFRSWHNLRALDPDGPWHRLTLAFAYATEAHLFITDLNQSPFNVGTRLILEDFTEQQLGELNRRYGCPLRSEDEVRKFHKLLGGHPYLSQRGLYEMVRHKTDFAKIEAQADLDEGVFGDHLRRMLISVERDPELRDELCHRLRGALELNLEHFYRLRSGGLLVGDAPNNARFRCELYKRYLSSRLA